MHNTNPAHLCRVTVSRTHLAAAVLLAAKEDIRYYLKGVHIEARDGRIRIVATTGTVLGICKAQRQTTDIGEGSLIVPSGAIADILKKIPKSLDTVTFRRLTEPRDNEPNSKPGPGRWDVEEVEALGGGLVFKAVEGVFPDWRRVLPKDTTGESCQFDPDLIVQMHKAAKALRGNKADIHIHQNGTSAALVHVPGEDHFVGVLMPFRTYKVGAPVPSAASLSAAFA